jgi:AcrR family transcriptional regulator
VGARRAVGGPATARRPTLASRAASPASRRARGSPAETRRRLVAAAAVAFNRDGYDGTDSNRIAREAGYSPGAFYKHFADKQEAFLAAHAEWVSGEWAAIEQILAAGGPPRATARAVVDAVVGLHRRWRGMRRSLRALAGAEPRVRRAWVAERARQLDAMARLAGPGDRAGDALLLYLVERAADAIADGEPPGLGVPAGALIELLASRVEARLRRARRAGARG